MTFSLDRTCGMMLNRGMENTCQHCGEEVTFVRRPADAGYAAFAHTATNSVACTFDAEDHDEYNEDDYS